MIIRRRSKPLPLQKLEAVIPRLHHHHPRLNEIKHEVNKLYKGYIGENKVDYHIDQLPNSYTILHDVYLRPPQSNSFQIDSLICTDNAIYMIESKNFNDKIIFNTIHNQFTRVTDTIEKGYRDPITQVKNARHKLMDWLDIRSIHDIPIYYFIAISDPSTIISVIGDDEAIAKVVKHAEFIPQKVIELEAELEKSRVTKWSGRSIGRLILQACEEFDYDILSSLGVKNNDIKTGVKCSECNLIGMLRGYGIWKCGRCEHKSKVAHISAIADYFRLGNKWMTNKSCMNFLSVNSSALTTRLLKSSNLVYERKCRRWLPVKK